MEWVHALAPEQKAKLKVALERFHRMSPTEREALRFVERRVLFGDEGEGALFGFVEQGWEPAPHPAISVVTEAVWGIMLTVNDRRPQSNTVRLTPSIAIDPL